MIQSVWQQLRRHRPANPTLTLTVVGLALVAVLATSADQLLQSAVRSTPTLGAPSLRVPGGVTVVTVVPAVAGPAGAGSVSSVVGVAGRDSGATTLPTRVLARKLSSRSAGAAATPTAAHPTTATTHRRAAAAGFAGGTGNATDSADASDSRTQRGDQEDQPDAWHPRHHDGPDGAGLLQRLIHPHRGHSLKHRSAANR